MVCSMLSRFVNPPSTTTCPGFFSRFLATSSRSRTYFEAASSAAPGASFEPPAAQRDTRPDSLDQAEWPGSLQEAICRSQHAGARKRQDEPVASLFQGVRDQHQRHRHESEQRQAIHSPLPLAPCTAASRSGRPATLYSLPNGRTKQNYRDKPDRAVCRLRASFTMFVYRRASSWIHSRWRRLMAFWWIRCWPMPSAAAPARM